MAKTRRKRSTRRSSRTSGRRPRRSKISKAARRTRPHTSRTEVKRVDLYAENIEVDSTSATLTLLNGVQLGTRDYERIGKMVSAKGIELDIALVPNPAVPSTTFTDDVIKVVVLWDSAGGFAPPVADIFQSVSSTGVTNSAKAWSFPNWNFKDRFTVLWQHEWLTPKYTSGAAIGTPIDSSKIGPMSSDMNLYIKKYIKLKGLRTKFTGVGNTFADIASGALYFCTLSSFGAGAAWEVKLNSRYTYSD